MHLQQMSSSEAHSRLRERFQFVDQTVSANRALRAGPSVYRVGSPLSPRARWQVARGRKFKSCLLRSGGDAPERRVLCRKSRLFVGVCVWMYLLSRIDRHTGSIDTQA